MGMPVSSSTAASPLAACAGDMVEMRRLAPDHRAQSDDRIVPFPSGQRFRSERKFPRARNLDDLDVVRVGPRALQGVQCSGQQTFSDEAVESRAKHGKLEPARIEISFGHLRHMG